MLFQIESLCSRELCTYFIRTETYLDRDMLRERVQKLSTNANFRQQETHKETLLL